MNILMVTMQMDIGGAETHILELCRALARMGHHITLVSNGGVYAEMLSSDGVRHVTLPLHTKSPLSVLTAKAGLDKCIREGARTQDGTFLGDYHIVHAHARIPAWICGLLWDKYKKHPLTRDGKTVPLFRFVTTAHLNFSINPLWRRISRWGERTMSVSEDIVEYLVDEYGIPRNHIQTTINGIDMEKFSPDADFTPILTEFGLDKNHRRLVYMSRLDEDRAAYAYTMARIAPTLAQRFPDLDILIVGGGTEESAIRALADKANAEAGRKIVTMTGGRADTHRFCAAADVFVGVSRSALEAMSAAKPVIVAGNQGALGIFDESKLTVAVDTNFCCRGCGLLTDTELCDQITTLLSEPDERRLQRGQYCQRIIREYYTADRMARDYVSLYENALAAPVYARHAKAQERTGVLLSGYYGFGNMGDESLLATISASLAEAIPGVQITALTRHPQKDSVRTGLHCVNRMGFWQVWREMGRTRLFLSGGGSLLQDVTSGKSLQYYTALLSLAKRCGMTTVVYANGIGPIRREKNKRLVARTLQDCDAISVRDADSYRLLQEMGVAEDKLQLRADPAFLLQMPPESEQTKTRNRLGLSELAPGSYVVLSLRRLHRKRDKAEDNRLAGEMAKVCAGLYTKYGLTTVLVPMQQQNDRPLALQVSEKMTAMGIADAVRIVEPESAGEMLSVLAGAKLTIGMRLHCLIYAAVAGVPMIGLSYDPKIDALLRSLQQSQQSRLHLYNAAEVQADTLLTGVAEVLQNEDAIRHSLREATAEMRKRCEEDVRSVASRL